MKAHPFEEFLATFIPKVSEKNHQLNKALWILETTGSEDAADLKASLDIECKMLFNDKKTYEQLLAWEKKPPVDPLLQRQLNILCRAFKANMFPKEILEKISKKEAELSLIYATSRPKCDGKTLSENDIKEVLKKENDPKKRKKVWEASKEVALQLAPKILELVRLRNEGAKSLGYPDYFQMQLDLQEVKGPFLMKFLDELCKHSQNAYQKVLQEIEKKQMTRFKELGPWAWSDPFAQEDPLDTHELDELVKKVDIEGSGRSFFKKMGFDVDSIIKRSDMYEREGKNQHAFCINIDRKQDIRTLNNIKPSIRWLETVLHELGHAVYELGYEDHLPWLLREPPHMIPTEAMALISGRQAYLPYFLKEVLPKEDQNPVLIKKAEESLKRRQLIFSRWVLVMTHFEQELYRNPTCDLNKLWWSLVEKYQGIQPPKGREKMADWAAKYHIAMAPVYYYSYLLGEVFASALQEKIFSLSAKALSDPKAGTFLKKSLFGPGNCYPWDQLIEKVLGKPLNDKAWVEEFACL